MRPQVLVQLKASGAGPIGRPSSKGCFFEGFLNRWSETRSPFPAFRDWYPHPELNGNQRFRKPPLYPFELWGQSRASVYARGGAQQAKGCGPACVGAAIPAKVSGFTDGRLCLAGRQRLFYLAQPQDGAERPLSKHCPRGGIGRRARFRF